jgi:hypothetical protein
MNSVYDICINVGIPIAYSKQIDLNFKNNNDSSIINNQINNQTIIKSLDSDSESSVASVPVSSQWNYYSTIHKHKIPLFLRTDFYFKYLYLSGIELPNQWIKLKPNNLEILGTNVEPIIIHKSVAIVCKMINMSISDDNTVTEISLDIPDNYLRYIIQYLEYTYDNLPNITLLEQPTLKSISTIFNDPWYDIYFNNITENTNTNTNTNTNNLKNIGRVQKYPTQPEIDEAAEEIQTADPLRIQPIQNMYIYVIYLCIDDFDKIILSYIGYHINKCKTHYEVLNMINLPEPISESVYIYDQDKFINMTKKEENDFKQAEIDKWSILP